jgi:hypothetical protein
LHGVTCADPDDGKEQDLNIVLTVVKGVRGIVNGLDIEKAFAAVTTDEFLIAIES